eukprot:TRINITY_DN21533_c0_g1_i2.p1 TRINITY_DN21533_c0_g1~~TRINITY_DN21533_c0_g1_i2.p1  ORF type:complete len:104 (+),score=18.05 TRINITY_DN21533_c0_g1_i2:384-695(+)
MAREERLQKSVCNESRRKETAMEKLCKLIHRWRSYQAAFLRRQAREQNRHEAAVRRQADLQRREAARLEEQARRQAQGEQRARWRWMNRKDITMAEILGTGKG